MTELVQWSKAWMTWSPEGYVLRTPIWIDERPLHESRMELRKAVDGAVGEFAVVSVSVSPMEIRRSKTATDADPGELEIVTRRMIDADAAGQLRDTVSNVLRAAVEEAERAGKVDDKAAKLVLAALRQPAS